MPDYDERRRAEFLNQVNDEGPWILAEWNGSRWVHIAKVTDRSELDEWLAGSSGA